MTMHKPPGAFVPPTADSFAADQDRRVHALEQRPQPRPGEDRHCITATTAVPLAETLTTATCAPWWGAIHMRMVIVHVTGDTAGAYITIRRGGTDVISLGPLAAGRHPHGCDVVWGIGDTLDVVASGSADRLMVEMFTNGDTSRGLVFSPDPDDTPGG
jgi:hypothetical protein